MVHSQKHYNFLRLLFKGNEWSLEKARAYEELILEAESYGTYGKDFENSLSACLGLF